MSDKRYAVHSEVTKAMLFIDSWYFLEETRVSHIHQRCGAWKQLEHCKTSEKSVSTAELQLG